MNLKIWHKLALILISITTLTVVMSIGLSQHSFKEGFLDYLYQQQRRLTNLGKNLLIAYEENGDWEFIRGNNRLWSFYLPPRPEYFKSREVNHRLQHSVPVSDSPFRFKKKFPKLALLDSNRQRFYQLLSNVLENSLRYTPDWVRQHEPALVLLDLMLSGKDGLDICREIRQFSNFPIIMITARVDEIDRTLGLEIAVDDYICKPFSPREVVARAKAIFRRLEAVADGVQVHVSALQLDEEKYGASFNQARLDLTPVEFRLLSVLHSQQGKVFSRDQLMSSLYKDHRIVTDRTIDSHIKNLRKKLLQAGCEDEMIHSVYGIGYKYDF